MRLIGQEGEFCTYCKESGAVAKVYQGDKLMEVRFMTTCYYHTQYQRKRDKLRRKK